MQTGLIRIVVGLILVLGAVGGIENSITDQDLGLGLLIALAGIGLMAWASVDINRQTRETLQDLRKY
jgi:hypothetical protein